MSLLPFYSPSLGLGFDAGLLTVVEAKQGWRKSRSLRRADRLQLSEGLVRPSPDEPNITDVAALAKEIGRLTGNQRSRTAALVLPDRCAHMALLELDSLSAKTEERDAIIQWRLRRDLGLAQTPLRLASRIFWMQDAHEKHEPKASARVLAIAVREEIIVQYESACEAAGLLPVRIGIAGLYLLDFCRRQQAADGDLLCVTASSGVFSFIVLRQNCPLAFRRKVLSHAHADITAELIGTLQWYHDRQSIMRQLQQGAQPSLILAADDSSAIAAAGRQQTTHSLIAALDEPWRSRACVLTKEAVPVEWPSSQTVWPAVASIVGRLGVCKALFDVSLAKSEWRWAPCLQWSMVSVLVATWLFIGWCWLEGQSLQDETIRYQSATARQEGATRAYLQQMAREELTLTKDQMERIERKMAFAKQLIDKRTFSWVELLHNLEEALPSRASIASIKLNAQDKTIAMAGKVKTISDLDVLAKHLEDHAAFSSVTLAQHHQDVKQRRESQVTQTAPSSAGEADEIMEAVSFSLTVGYRPVF